MKYKAAIYFLLITSTCFVKSSINEDIEILKEITGSYPTPYHLGCKSHRMCIGGIDFGVYSGAPDFASTASSRNGIRSIEVDEIESYEDAGVIFYWDETNGLDIRDYEKLCGLEKEPEKYVSYPPQIKIKNYNYKTKKCNDSYYGCYPPIANMYIDEEDQLHKNKGWGKSAKKILNSENSNIEAALKKEKIKSPYFSIWGSYSYEDNEMLTENKISSLEQTNFYCDIVDIDRGDSDLFSSYITNDRINTLIRTPVKQSFQQKISDIKNRNKIALTDQFEKINQIDNAREISYFALSSKYSDIPEIDDEIFETCEEFVPRVIDFWENKTKLAYAKVGLGYDAEDEEIYFHLDNVSELSMNKEYGSYGGKITLPNSSYDMEAAYLRGNNSAMAIMTKDKKVPHIFNFSWEAIFDPQFISYDRKLARENFKFFEGYIIFEYFDMQRGCGDYCSISAHKILGYGILDTNINKFIFIKSNNVGLSASTSINPKDCREYGIRDFVGKGLDPKNIIFKRKD